MKSKHCDLQSLRVYEFTTRRVHAGIIVVAVSVTVVAVSPNNRVECSRIGTTPHLYDVTLTSYRDARHFLDLVTASVNLSARSSPADEGI